MIDMVCALCKICGVFHFFTLKKFISGDYLLQLGDWETTLQIGSLPMRSGELTGMYMVIKEISKVKKLLSFKRYIHVHYIILKLMSVAIP